MKFLITSHEVVQYIYIYIYLQRSHPLPQIIKNLLKPKMLLNVIIILNKGKYTLLSPWYDHSFNLSICNSKYYKKKIYVICVINALLIYTEFSSKFNEFCHMLVMYSLINFDSNITVPPLFLISSFCQNLKLNKFYRYQI